MVASMRQENHLFKYIILRCQKQQSKLLNVIIQIIKQQKAQSLINYIMMKTSAIIKPSQVRSNSQTSEGRTNRISSIQIVKNTNKNPHADMSMTKSRCGTFSLPKTQPTKNSSTQPVIANCEEIDTIDIKLNEGFNKNDCYNLTQFGIKKYDDNSALTNPTIQNQESDSKPIIRNISTGRTLFKKRRTGQNMGITMSKQLIQQIQTCPQMQITQFCSNFDTSFYLHKVEIDYGRLDQPITNLSHKSTQQIENNNKSKDIEVMEENKHGNKKQQKQNYQQEQGEQQLQTLRNMKNMRNIEQKTTQKPKKLQQHFRQVRSTQLQQQISNSNKKDGSFLEERSYDEGRSRQKSRQDRQLRWNKQIKEMKQSFIKILNNNEENKLLTKSMSINKSKQQRHTIINDLFENNYNISSNLKSNSKEYFCPRLKQVVAAKSHNTIQKDAHLKNSNSMTRTKNNSLNKINMHSGSQYDIPQQQTFIQPLPKCISFSQQSTHRYHPQNTQIKTMNTSIRASNRKQRQGNRQGNKQNNQSPNINYIPHCRIIRSYVGGGKMQIKIISYPDNSEYMKVCGYENTQGASNKKRK